MSDYFNPTGLLPEKPGHHRVHVDLVRAWRKSADEDRNGVICKYCDEDIRKSENIARGNVLCTQSCGFNHVWVDTATLAKINLEGAKP